MRVRGVVVFVNVIGSSKQFSLKVKKNRVSQYVTTSLLRNCLQKWFPNKSTLSQLYTTMSR